MAHLYHGIPHGNYEEQDRATWIHRQISIHGHSYYNMKCTAEVYFVNA